ncbi:histone-lysine N-methyltransferase, H3 lysine-79 specific [Diutina catenulata]
MDVFSPKLEQSPERFTPDTSDHSTDEKDEVVPHYVSPPGTRPVADLVDDPPSLLAEMEAKMLTTEQVWASVPPEVRDWAYQQFAVFYAVYSSKSPADIHDVLNEDGDIAGYDHGLVERARAQLGQWSAQDIDTVVTIDRYCPERWPSRTRLHFFVPKHTFAECIELIRQLQLAGLSARPKVRKGEAAGYLLEKARQSSWFTGAPSRKTFLLRMKPGVPRPSPIVLSSQAVKSEPESSEPKPQESGSDSKPMHKQPNSANSPKPVYKVSQVPPLPASPPRPEPVDDEFDPEPLEYLLKNDLTRTAVRDVYRQYRMADLVEVARTRYGEPDFTYGEKVVMKRGVEQGVDFDTLAPHFPFRSRPYLESRFHETQFVCGPRPRFKNATEELVYEAKWSALATGAPSSRERRRARRAQTDLDAMQREAAAIKAAKPVHKLSPEELAQRAARKAAREAAQAEERAQRREKARLAAAARAERIAAGWVPKHHHGMLESLVDATTHFSSVVGDGKPISEGQKRRRHQTEVWSPDAVGSRPAKRRLVERSRQHEKKLARAQASKATKQLRKTSRESSPAVSARPKRASATPEPDDDDEPSPFDPVSIEDDVKVPLNGRRLFAEDIFRNRVPELEFAPTINGTLGYDALTAAGSVVTYDDNLAAEICTTHRKNYKSLPIGFPEFMAGDAVNESNTVKVRFLMYPQHYESFVLCQPKSNELDPVYEIVKLMQIHCGLYFDGCARIQYEVMGFCQSLENAVEASDIAWFVRVIDTWNALMLVMSPNRAEVHAIHARGDADLNRELKRLYCAEAEAPPLTAGELVLEMWYADVVGEALSPAYGRVQWEGSEEVNGSDQLKGSTHLDGSNQLNGSDCLNAHANGHANGHANDHCNNHPNGHSNGHSDLPNGHSPKHGVAEPTNVVDSEVIDLPDDFYTALFHRLQSKTSLSRFVSQQILLRVYARVVSTNSRKLRAYKSFTAEVYGELLPSFTSEVLEKVGLRPNQKFYDLGSGVGNTTFQAALEFGAAMAGGCELMEHASKLTALQEALLSRHLALFGLRPLNLNFALSQSFVDNPPVKAACLDCEVIIVNNYLFDVNLNAEVGRLLYGLRTGTKIISLRNFVPPRYRFSGDSIFDRLRVEKHEMSDFMSVSWTANKVPYYISTVEETILPEYLEPIS